MLRRRVVVGALPLSVFCRGCATSATPPASDALKKVQPPPRTSGADAEQQPAATIHTATSAAGAVIRFTESALPAEGVVEAVSKACMKAEGREGHVRSRDWNEETSYPPILAQGKKNIYDFTDDIPKHVKPMHHWQYLQQREYFRSKRDQRTFFQKAVTGAAIATAAVLLGGTIMFTRIWLEQPKEVAVLRSEILQNAYGRVLELGAGQGTSVGLYPYPVHEIVMVDQNAQQLQRLRYRLPKTTYPKYEVRHLKTEKLDEFQDHEFDCVVDMFGLCHYRDPVAVLRQMQRVVKPTGVILLLEHGRTQHWTVNKFLDLFGERHTVNSHGCRWNLPMRDFFKQARLEVKEYKNMHYGTTHYVIAYPEVLNVSSIVDEERAREKAKAMATATAQMQNPAMVLQGAGGGGLVAIDAPEEAGPKRKPWYRRLL